MTGLTLPADLEKLLSQPDEMGRKDKPITAGDLSDFEKGQNVALPEDYKRFCLTYGSRTLNNKAIFTFKSRAEFKDGKKKKIDIGSISGPPYILETYNRYMDPLYNNSGPRLPEHLYPFTYDSGYGHCLLDLSAENHGRILYIVVKAQTFDAQGYGWDQVGTVAGSFSDFVAGLTPDFL